MNRIELKQVTHNVKIGDICDKKTPNVIEDSLFYDGDKIVGFYIKNIADYDKRMAEIADIANAEFRSSRVPKSTMKRSSGFLKKENEVLQYSTILGYVPPKPHMRRNYATMSSVHNVASAQNFIKAMMLLCRSGEELIARIAPEIYHNQRNLISERVPEKFRFGTMFTSSISNFNIAAAYHRDNANIEGCVNIIIAKKKNAEGGNTTVPDYGVTVDSQDNSLLVYPAWRNVHGVTPIEVKKPGGYRNSLVFYPLKVK